MANRHPIKTLSRQDLLSVPLGLGEGWILVGFILYVRLIMQKNIPDILCQRHPWTAMARTLSYQTSLSCSMAPSFFPPTRSCFVSTPTVSGLKLPGGDKQVCTRIETVFAIHMYISRRHWSYGDRYRWGRGFRAVRKGYSQGMHPSCGRLEG